MRFDIFEDDFITDLLLTADYRVILVPIDTGNKIQISIRFLQNCNKFSSYLPFGNIFGEIALLGFGIVNFTEFAAVFPRSDAV